MLSQPTQSEIRTAKNQAVGGGRKRCRKGKNCSAACIQTGMVCLVEMPESAGLATTKMRDLLKEWKPKNPHLSPKPSEPVGDYAPIKRLTGEELGNTVRKLAKEGKTPAEIVKATGYWKDSELFNKAIKEFRPTPRKERVVGEDLIKLIKSLPSDISKSDLVRAAGYTSRKPDGSERLNFTNFYMALLDAKELKDFKEAGGYFFRQKMTPVKLPTTEELQRKLGVNELVIKTWEPNIHKLMEAGADLSSKAKGKPYIDASYGELALVTKIGKNTMALSVDDHGTILWKVNDSVSKNNSNSEIPPKEKLQMAMAARKSWDILLRSFEEGKILATSAYVGDGSGDSRARAYEATGFGKPFGDEVGDSQYGKVTSRGLMPLDPYDGRNLHEDAYDLYDNDDEYGYDTDDDDYAENWSESSQNLDNDTIDEAFMVILFGNTGTEKI
jgi:hypothetical protein